MAVSNERSVLARYFCCLTSKFAPEDVIAWCQDEWRAHAILHYLRARRLLFRIRAMPMVVEPPSWQDQLRDEMHELETRARLDDALALPLTRS